MYDNVPKAAGRDSGRLKQREMIGGLRAMAGNQATDECSSTPTPTSLAQRIAMQANESQYAVRATVDHAERVARLRELAEKHPETVELFDLLTRLGFR